MSAVDPPDVEWVRTPLGPLAARFTRRGLQELRYGAGGSRRGDPSAGVQKLQRQLDEYFAGRRRQFDFDLDLDGTPFQLQVWEQLLAIPYGATRSYGEVAAALGRPGGGRAVGGANGANRIAIVIPCHRVIGADGRCGGYSCPGGTKVKRALLDLEGAGYRA